MNLKELGVKPKELSKIIGNKLYGRCVKIIKKVGIGNNVVFASDGKILDIYVASIDRKIESVELDNLIANPLERRMMNAFSGGNFSKSMEVIKEYLRMSNEVFILKPNTIEKKVDVYQKVKSGYKKISIDFIINQAYEA